MRRLRAIWYRYTDWRDDRRLAAAFEAWAQEEADDGYYDGTEDTIWSQRAGS